MDLLYSKTVLIISKKKRNSCRAVDIPLTV